MEKGYYLLTVVIGHNTNNPKIKVFRLWTEETLCPAVRYWSGKARCRIKWRPIHES